MAAELTEKGSLVGVDTAVIAHVKLVGMSMTRENRDHQSILFSLKTKLRYRHGVVVQARMKYDNQAYFPIAVVPELERTQLVPLFYLPKGQVGGIPRGLGAIVDELGLVDIPKLVEHQGGINSDLRKLNFQSLHKKDQIAPLRADLRLMCQIESIGTGHVWITLHADERGDVEGARERLYEFWSGIEGKSLLWTEEELDTLARPW
jgi:hypothetical protein